MGLQVYFSTRRSRRWSFIHFLRKNRDQNTKLLRIILIAIRDHNGGADDKALIAALF